MPAHAESRPMRTSLFVLLALGLVALAGWGRSAHVLHAGARVKVMPTDSHYYLRFAVRQLKHFPRFDAFDPYVNFPGGARIEWPPLHAYLVGAAVWLGGIATPERGGAWADLSVGLAELLVLAWVARRRIGERATLALLFLFGLTPAVVAICELGEADHHVHEPFFAVLLVLLLGAALERRSRREALLAGVVAGATVLFTPTSVLLIPLAASAVGLSALAAPSREEAGRRAALGAWSALAATLTVALGVAVFGSPRELSFIVLSGFQPLWSAACFGLACGVGFARARSRRAWPLLVLGLLTAVVLAPELLHAVRDLARADPLTGVVFESRPLWRDWRAAVDFFQGQLFLLPFALAGLVVACVRERRAMHASALAAAVVLGLAGLLQARFCWALGGLLALVTVLGLPALPLTPRIRTVGLVVVALAFASLLQILARPAVPSWVDRVRPTLAWLEANTPPPGDPWGDAPARYGVVADFEFGHLLTLIAERPAIATPFSLAPWHVAGNARASEVLAAHDDELAYRAALATGARYVLATPYSTILGKSGWSDRATLARRLLEHAGMQDDQGPASAHFRWLHDSAEPGLEPGVPFARVFEVVPGAELHGRATPGAELSASLDVPTGGQPLHYRRTARANADGTFSLRVAYPAARYLIEAPGLRASVPVAESDVREGRAVAVPPGIGLESGRSSE